MSAATDTIAVILAAGRGRRLGELTLNKPKCLLSVGGLPILYHELKALRGAGISDIAIVTGFKKNEVEQYAKERFRSINFKFIYNPVYETTGTLYGLALAAEVINDDRQVLQINGDVLFDPRVIEQMLSADASKSHIATEMRKCGEEEIKVVLASSGEASFLNKQVLPEEAVGEAIGINKFTPEFWKALSVNLKKLKNNFPREYFEYAIERTIAEGLKIHPLDIGCFRAVEIDYPEDLAAAEAIFTHANASYAKIS